MKKYLTRIWKLGLVFLCLFVGVTIASILNMNLPTELSGVVRDTLVVISSVGVFSLWYVREYHRCCRNFYGGYILSTLLITAIFIV